MDQKKMSRLSDVHRTILFGGNLIIVAYLTWITIHSGSDKSPGVFLLFYFILLSVNVLAFILLSIIRSPAAVFYKITIATLLILLIPLSVLIAFW